MVDRDTALYFINASIVIDEKFTMMRCAYTQHVTMLFNKYISLSVICEVVAAAATLTKNRQIDTRAVPLVHTYRQFGLPVLVQ